MSGAYAHFTVVDRLDRIRLEAVGLPPRAMDAVLSNRKFCELGAVSPDYPYLTLASSDARRWADLMHWHETGGVLRAGVRRLRAMTGHAAQKGLAWLLGYAAHVATDVTVHPVIALKVGGVTGHDQAHRTCEMHQDAYVFQTLNVGALGVADFLSGGIGACGSATREHALDDDVRALWAGMLADVHGVEFARNAPDPDLWHRCFDDVIRLASPRHLLPLARHVAADLGLTYPQPDQIDRQWIARLPAPDGSYVDYDALFEQVLGNVARTWKWIADAVVNGQDEALVALGGWNLDTGRDDYDQLVFWGRA